MNCKETQHLLHAYLDGELDVAHSLAVEQHLQTCAVCQREHQSYRTLSTAIKGGSLYFQAPSALQKRVRLALPQSASASRPARRASWPWLSAAALLLLLLGGLAFWAFTLLRPGFSDDNRMARAVIDSHERSLVDGRMVDLLSSDPNALKLWFESKLGFSPPVINLTLQGYSLVGGRVDFLDNHAVAAIVYKSGNHVINLFAWPSSQSADQRTLSMQGYYLTHWSKYGMNCWAVADLDEDQLQQFAHLINQHLETFLRLAHQLSPPPTIYAQT
ncbi:MAG TPA: zf-HC2 domain-containing protein [Ktedonobacteraceae bacterium]